MTSTHFSIVAGLLLTACAASSDPAPKTLRMNAVRPVAISLGAQELHNSLPIPTGVYATDRARQDLGGMWRFTTDPTDQGRAAKWYAADFTGAAGWRSQRVPGSWNHEFADLFHYFGPGWYRLAFTPSDEMRDAATARLRFEGIFREATVWLNGTKLGDQDLPYLPFEFDVSPQLEPGENILVVRIDNELRTDTLPGYALLQDERLGWWKYGGLTRDVYLEAAAPVRVFRAQIIPSAAGAGGGAWRATLGVWNAGTATSGALRVSVTDPDGALQTMNINADFPAGATFFEVRTEGTSQRVWSPGDPALFLLAASVTADEKTDAATYRFGLRSFTTAGQKLLLNGKPYYLMGMNRHEDHPDSGPVEPAAVIDADLALLRGLHVNHIRTVHYPNRTLMYDRLDEEGFTAQEEIPLYQSYAEHMLKKPLQDKAERALAGMVLRDFNHPSIIIWSVGNEDETFSSKAAGDVIGTLIRSVKSLDTSRPVLYVSNVLPAITERITHGVEHADILAYNHYFGWFYGKTGNLAPFFDAVRRNFPDKPMIVTEWGAEAIGGRRASGPVPAEESPSEHSLTEDFQAAYFKKVMDVYASRDDVMGQMPWVFADHFVHWEGGDLNYGAEFAEPWKQVFGLYRYDRSPKLAADVLAQGYAEQSLRLRAKGIETYR